MHCAEILARPALAAGRAIDTGPARQVGTLAGADPQERATVRGTTRLLSPLGALERSSIPQSPCTGNYPTPKMVAPADLTLVKWVGIDIYPESNYNYCVLLTDSKYYIV